MNEPIENVTAVTPTTALEPTKPTTNASTTNSGSSPAASPNPVAQSKVQPIALSELPTTSTAGKKVITTPDVNPLHQLKARLQVCVGESTITVGELLAAREHQVLRLDRALDQPVDLLLEGKVVARGQLMAVDDHFAVRLTELPIPLKV